MAIKLNVGFSRKVGEPNYGSRGASVNLEVELERSAIEDTERFRSEVEGVFERAREAVEQELQRDVSPAPAPAPESSTFRGGQSAAHGQNGDRQPARPATPNQIRAIETIARHQCIDLGPLLAAEFNGKTVEELTIVEASFLIDQLKSFPIPYDADAERED